jgi:peptide/nickel transport system permease protein
MKGFAFFLSRWQNLLALWIVTVYFLLAILAPTLSPHDDPEQAGPYKVVGRTTDQMPHPPSDSSLLGTLPGQLDVFHTVIWGARSALRFGLVTALCTALLGTLLGAVSGYTGGLANSVIMRVTDAFLAFPVIAGVWLFQQILLPPRLGGELTTWLQKTVYSLNINPVMVTFILFSWMPYARITNTLVLQIRNVEYIEAARSLGVGNLRLIIRHILPNAIAPALVLAARDVGAMVILESAFTFIGMGGSIEWGVLLVRGRDYVIGIGGDPLAYWWTFVPASVALAAFGIGWSLLGDGLNDQLNPRRAR